MEYDISIVIVNYNGQKYLKVLFDSLLALKSADFSFEIVFTDNASDDDSVPFLETHYTNIFGDKLTIVRNKSNLGFAGGNNAGVMVSRGKYVVFLNNDTRVEKDWLYNLYHTICDNPKYGIVASKLLFFYDFIKMEFKDAERTVINRNISVNGASYTIDVKFCKDLIYGEIIECNEKSQIYIPLLNGVTDYEIDIITARENEKETTVKLKYCKEDIDKLKVTLVQNAGSRINEDFNGYDLGFCCEDSPEYMKSYEVEAGCGAGIIVKKDDLLECGMFDERFFMYYEDTDLSYRIRKTGKKILYCHNAIIRHIHTGSSQEWSPLFIYYVTRNRLMFMFKNISRKLALKFMIKELRQSIREKDAIRKRACLNALKFAFFGKVNPF